MAGYISIFFTTVFVAIFMLPTNGRTNLKDSASVEPDEKHNQQKVSLIGAILRNIVDPR